MHFVLINEEVMCYVIKKPGECIDRSQQALSSKTRSDETGPEAEVHLHSHSLYKVLHVLMLCWAIERERERKKLTGIH